MIYIMSGIKLLICQKLPTKYVKGVNVFNFNINFRVYMSNLRYFMSKSMIQNNVTSPHFVRSSHLPKSAELAKAILTTINSAIKKSHTRWLLLMAGTTRLELATSCVTGMRSNQTELRSHKIMVEMKRIELLSNVSLHPQYYRFLDYLF